MLSHALKTLWVDALRSGKYQQTTTVLRSPQGGYCCLGVLCDVMGLEWEAAATTGLVVDYVPSIDSTGAQQSGFLSHKTCGEAGLDVAQAVDLSEMNDAGHSFDEIANYIEANL